MMHIIAYVILGLVALGSISALFAMYNRLVMLRNNVDKAFGNIDVLLKQRADEIPNLIKVVKESMKYEDGMLTKLTDMRAAYMGATSDDAKIKLANDMQQQVKSILAVAENYPALKASENFQLLQTRVSGIEDAISDRREFFNESVNMYNIGIAELPDVILAKILGYSRKSLLQISEAEKQYDGITF